MKAAWDKLGGAAGALGVPVADQNTGGDTVSQKFSGGQVSWDSKKNTFSTDPGNLADQLTGLQVPPQSATSAAPAAPAPDTKSHNRFQWHNWWLWWIVPLAVLLLASVAAFAVMMVRRRSSAGADDEYDDEDDYHGAPAEPGHWASSEAEQSAGRARFVDPDAENSAYASSGRGWPDHDVPDAPERRWSDLPDTDSDRGPSSIGSMFTRHGMHESDDLHDVDVEEDPDSVDTAPTLVQDDEREHSGRHAALNPDTGKSVWTAPDDESYLPGPQSLFAPVHSAVPPPAEWEDTDSTAGVMVPDIGHEAVAPPAIHLPLADPHEAPEGYPIKGSMRSSSYFTTDSAGYHETVAEIWFATEELAQANGFSKAD
jgi:uncharacterized protein with LGFP repeats